VVDSETTGLKVMGNEARDVVLVFHEHDEFCWRWSHLSQMRRLTEFDAT